ncbi:SDR family oxidoreductase [Pseudoduganella albidiflava]|uniref:SDR family NAD(P)-dependent oxidoreductase n=1 Tax=Pseudoduganella albidiflava TaxID=321983 RepID=A0A411X2F3_9BURK|nr:SDR family oxidoreductase [Pseudoduganella albidiflava]QBI03052.1 SDR family NAD(P)-dependent oxidoreductase [Pseudoduganella albidiflava]GGY58574.1 short-chain dehydrogenase [Pseudoduganella albidiflava]
MRLKRLSDQVIVITGATSGIGLTTARMAAARGAKVVLAARGEEALEQLEQQLRQRGAEALAVPTDVGKKDEVHALAQAALKRFGRIDTWINNAGVSIFGRAEEVSEEDNHRLFQTNFWGVVNGSLEAVKHLKKDGGALINLGSELSEVAVPLQGMYAASKHAVKGYTDALRMELEHDRLPISVTLVKPAAIDTMFPVHAKNYMSVEPTLPAPVYPPEMVAEAILDAAQHPKRDVFVGNAAKANAVGGFTLPRLFDKLGETAMWNQQRTNKPSRWFRNDALHSPDPDQELQQRLGIQTTGETSYRPVTRSPLKLALLGGGALVAAWMLTRPAGDANQRNTG